MKVAISSINNSRHTYFDTVVFKVIPNNVFYLLIYYKVWIQYDNIIMGDDYEGHKVRPYFLKMDIS